MKDFKKEITIQIKNLYNDGVSILTAENTKQEANSKSKTPSRGTTESSNHELPIEITYQDWYTKALPVVKQVIPDRYDEFVEQYKIDRRKEITFATYTISDYLIGLRVTRGYEKVEVFNSYNAYFVKFQHQIAILGSALARIDTILSNIEGILQAEMFDDELSTAEELVKKGHYRAAGALAGVTLERHFGSLMRNRELKLSKKDPTISDYNDLFKKEEIYDVPTWRFIQRLGDLRNLAVHFKEREPTKDEITELINGTSKTIKTVS